MDPRLRTHLDDYHGMISARAAALMGLGPNDLRSLVAKGDLVRVTRGAYVDGALLAAADDEEAHRLRTTAVVLSRHGSLAASHQSAAVLHGLPVLRAELEPIRVLGHVVARIVWADLFSPQRVQAKIRAAARTRRA